MDRTTEDKEGVWSAAEVAGGDPVWALVLAWCGDAPERVGEVALLDGRSVRWVLGRGDAPLSDPRSKRAAFVRQRPGGNDPGGALTAPGLSREQLSFAVAGGALMVRRLGRRPLLLDGVATDHAEVRLGAVLSVGSACTLLVERRPAVLPVPRAEPTSWFPFGHADAWGMIGESPTAWALRDQLALVAQLDAHTLVAGPTGAGKELAARALHAASARALGPFIARNATTLPPGIVDAELFGNAKNYPHFGLPERPGIVGAAHGGVLFLDEIGELPESVQTHLLRVLDQGGEYTPLGDSRPRRSDFRLIGATNRDEAALRLDFHNRFRVRLAVPALDARRADVPLLLRAILERARAELPFAERFFDPHPRLAPAFVVDLLKRRFAGNFRELEAVVWGEILAATGDTLGGGADPWPTARAAPPAPRPATDAERIREALHLARGNLAEAARELGLSSRFALYRRIHQLGLDLATLRDLIPES